MKKREIFKLISHFHNHVEDKGLAPKSIKSIIWGALASFYKNHDVPFPPPPKSMRSVKPRTKNTKRTNKEEIQKGLKIASKRDRAIILSQESSGLSSSDISNVTYRQFTDGYDPLTNVCTIHYVRQKTGIKAHSFFNPEACEAIIKYCEIRNASPVSDKNGTKKDTRNEKPLRTVLFS